MELIISGAGQDFVKVILIEIGFTRIVSDDKIDWLN